MNNIRLALAAGVLAMVGTTSAYAGGDVGWSISIGSPGYYHRPAPRVYYEPRVVYEPRVIYYEPAPIYFRYYDGPRHHHYRPHARFSDHRGHGYYKHHKHHRHEGRRWHRHD